MDPTLARRKGRRTSPGGGARRPAHTTAITATAERTADGITVTILGPRPPTLNAERTGANGGWRHQAEITRLWRGHTKVAAFQIRFGAASPFPLAGPLVATVIPLHADDRRAAQDVGACIPAAKAVIDGLRDARIITDDGPDVVTRLVFEAPIRTQRGDGLILHLGPTTVGPGEYDDGPTP